MVEALICAGDWLKTSNIEKKDEEDISEEDQQKEFQSGKYISLDLFLLLSLSHFFLFIYVVLVATIGEMACTKSQMNDKMRST